MFNRRMTILLGAAVALAPFAAGATSGPTQNASDPDKGVLIHDGFGTAAVFLDQMSDAERRAYAIGVVNGMLVSPLLGAPKERLRALERCFENMTDKQVAALLLKHIREHPERWHYGLHIESWVALKDGCTK